MGQLKHCGTPEKKILEPEIQQNLPKNCQISALFRLQNPKKKISFYVNAKKFQIYRTKGYKHHLLIRVREVTLTKHVNQYLIGAAESVRSLELS